LALPLKTDFKHPETKLHFNSLLIFMLGLALGAYLTLSLADWNLYNLAIAILFNIYALYFRVLRGKYSLPRDGNN
jgi:uncharacterized membrane protein YoaK (UPF0700 family)